MTLQELIDALRDAAWRSALDTTTVEIATSPNKDEWYRVADVEVTENHRGDTVVVINTD